MVFNATFNFEPCDTKDPHIHAGFTGASFPFMAFDIGAGRRGTIGIPGQCILDLSCVPCFLYDVKYIGLVSLWASILGYMLDLSFCYIIGIPSQYPWLYA